MNEQFNTVEDYKNYQMSVGQRITKVIGYALLVYLEAACIIYLGLFYFLAIFLPFLRNPIKSGINKLSGLIATQYNQIAISMSYYGDNTSLRIVSKTAQAIMYIFAVSFLFEILIYMCVFLFYGIFIWPLKKPVINSNSVLFNGCGHMFNRLTRCISFNESSNAAWKTTSIILQLVLHIIAAFVLFEFGACLAIIFLAWIWFYKTSGGHAVKRFFVRTGKHISCIVKLLSGSQPDDIEIEEDDDEDSFLHYKKDGTLDMRYSTSKEFEND